MKDEIARIREVEPEHAADMQRILDSATVVEPPAELPKEVLFGMTVDVRHAEDHSRTFRIVGVDEIETDPNGVSWLSPNGKSLLGSVVGQRVMLSVDGEPTNFTVTRIYY